VKLVSYGARGAERPGVLVGDHILDLCASDARLQPSLRAILEHDQLDRIAAWEAAAHRGLAGPGGGAPVLVARAGTRLGPPIPNPSKIVCIGLNYADHAAEQNRPLPETPLLFSKASTALVGTGDPIVLPPHEAKVDLEAELAVVIGRRGRRVSGEWQSWVAGYMCFNDVSGRGAQYSDKQFFRGKSFDTFAPSGPFLATRDEIPDPHALAIQSTRNGFVMQNSNTGQLVFRIPALLEYITRGMTLLPGDIIATGTPAGVGVFRNPPVFLADGDRVEVSIERLGTLSNQVRAEPS
jgi:2-keto-4-pentenoate hydratase/2-oxohepta-3-ene-1,7-dioic acid hydratase in catechol pathway